VLENIQKFGKIYNINCDFNLTTTFEICFSEKFAKEAADAFEGYKLAGGDVHLVKFYDGQEAKARTRDSGALYAYEWTTTKTVIHYINTCTADLVPDLSQFIQPNRVQSHAFIPWHSLLGKKKLEKKTNDGQSPLLDGTIMLGGTGVRSLCENPEAPSGFMKTFDDTSYSNFMARPEIPLRHDEGLAHTWTVILTITPKSGELICAAFHGNGRSSCTIDLVVAGLILIYPPGLVKLILGQTWHDTGLPLCFQINKERIDRYKEPIKSSI
ncbi:uncharacterized protein N7477_000834, partial [Penicillium maclennaniae]|uniref:uncharacterized protein n=1 Tax=Penicillium maclennaniae TaxID=1343394 RepID=UPI002540689B